MICFSLRVQSNTISPYCLTHLLTCENCQALLEDAASDEHSPSTRSGAFSPLKFSSKVRVSKGTSPVYRLTSAVNIRNSFGEEATR